MRDEMDHHVYLNKHREYQYEIKKAKKAKQICCVEEADPKMI